MIREKNREYISLFVKALGLYFLCLPLGAINIGALGSALKIVAVFPVLVFFLSNTGKVGTPKAIIGQLTIVLILGISYIWSPMKHLWFDVFWGQLLFLILLLPTNRYSLSKAEREYLIKKLVWASRIMVVLVFYFSTYNGDGRLWFDGIISEDPNYLCTYFFFGIANVILKLLSGEKRVVSGIELLIYLFIMFATGSRSGLLSFLVLVGVFFVLYNQSTVKNIKIKKLIIVLIAIIGAQIALSYLPANIMERFLMSNVQGSEGSGRYEIWEACLNTFVHSNPLQMLFGWGAGCAAYAVSYFGHYYQVPHNAFLTFLLETGVIGLVGFCSVIFTAIKNVFINKRIFELSIIVAITFFAISASIVSFKPYWNIIILSLLFCKDEDMVC